MLEGGGEGDGQGKEQGRPGLVDGSQQGGGVLGHTSDEEEAGSRGLGCYCCDFCGPEKQGGDGEENSGWIGGIGPGGIPRWGLECGGGGGDKCLEVRV